MPKVEEIADWNYRQMPQKIRLFYPYTRFSINFPLIAILLNRHASDESIAGLSFTAIDDCSLGDTRCKPVRTAQRYRSQL
jgi:hypothetical protein